MDFLNKMLGKVGVGGDPFSLPILNKKKPTTPAVPSAIPAPTPVNINQAIDGGGIKLDSATKAPASPTPTIPKPVNPMNAPIIPQIDGGGVGETPIAPKINAQDATGEAKKPAIPQISPESESALSSAEKAYQDSLKISPEEISTQEDIDKLVEATKSAYRNTSGQAIPLEFITGQLRSIEERATGLAEPLERKLSRMQAARTASLEASKFGLERAQKKVDAERTAAEKLIPKAPEPFTLSPGEKRFSATGEVIATGGEKPLTQTQEAAQIAKAEKETATQQSATQTIGIVNSLLSGDRYKKISGATQTGSIPFFGDRAAVNEYDQLQGLLKLGIRSLIKGQGSVSDYEGKILGQAASSLSRLTSESQMKEALQKVRGVLKTNAGQETDVVVKDKDGKIIGRGLLNGKEIYEAVSDGNTIEYQ